MKYNIYAGLSGSFGGATYQGALEGSEDEAERTAWEYAIEEYESYGGMHGLLTWDDVAEENELNPREDIEEIDDLYMEEIESWIEYYAVPFDEDEDFDPEEYYEL